MANKVCCLTQHPTRELQLSIFLSLLLAFTTNKSRLTAALDEACPLLSFFACCLQVP